MISIKTGSLALQLINGIIIPVIIRSFLVPSDLSIISPGTLHQNHISRAGEAFPLIHNFFKCLSRIKATLARYHVCSSILRAINIMIIFGRNTKSAHIQPNTPSIKIVLIIPFQKVLLI
jgi:hypothetical protein